MSSLDLSKCSDDDLIRLVKAVEIKNTRVHFAKNCHRNTKGEKLEFSRFRHMLDLYNSVSPNIVIVGAAQVGKTDWLIVDTFATAFNNLSVFFVLPKVDFLIAYSKEKIKKPLSASPEYRAINKESITEAIQMIQFGPGLIKIVGGNVPSDFTSFSADLYVIDEIDKCDSMDNIEMGYSRLQGSIYKFSRIVSNPTTKEGPIWQHYLKSDQRVWKCPCQKCGKFFELDWFKSVVNEVEDGSGNVISHILRDTEWRVGIGRDIYIKCPDSECGGNIDRFHPDCFWESQNPDSKIEGYHMPSLISPLSSVEQGWAEYSHGLQNPSKMAKFYSMFLALPYAPVGSKVTTNLLFNCVGKTPESQFSVNCQFPDHATIPEGTHKGPCSMGIDTSPNHIDIRISSNERGKRKFVYVGKIDCQGQSVDSVEAKLHYLVELYNVSCAVIDIGPEKLLAMGFAKNAKCPVWLCKFLGRGEERLMKYNFGDMIISIDRTEALDRTYAQLKTAKNLLPTNYPYIMQGAYVSEMTALVREVSEDSKGNIKYSWTKGTDHAFLADTYDILAFDIIQEDIITGEQCVFVG